MSTVGVSAFRENGRVKVAFTTALEQEIVDLDSLIDGEYEVTVDGLRLTVEPMDMESENRA